MAGPDTLNTPTPTEPPPAKERSYAARWNAAVARLAVLAATLVADGWHVQYRLNKLREQYERGERRG